MIVGVDLAEEALAEPVDKEAEDGEPNQWTRISMRRCGQSLSNPRRLLLAVRVFSLHSINGFGRPIRLVDAGCYNR